MSDLSVQGDLIKRNKLENHRHHKSKKKLKTPVIIVVKLAILVEIAEKLQSVMNVGDKDILQKNAKLRTDKLVGPLEEM